MLEKKGKQGNRIYEPVKPRGHRELKVSTPFDVSGGLGGLRG